MTYITTKSGTVGINNGLHGDDAKPFWHGHHTGFNSKAWHYVPSGKWSDWVELAERILAIEAERKALVKEAEAA